MVDREVKVVIFKHHFQSLHSKCLQYMLAAKTAGTGVGLACKPTTMVVVAQT